MQANISCSNCTWKCSVLEVQTKHLICYCTYHRTTQVSARAPTTPNVNMSVCKTSACPCVGRACRRIRIWCAWVYVQRRGMSSCWGGTACARAGGTRTRMGSGGGTRMDGSGGTRADGGGGMRAGRRGTVHPGNCCAVSVNRINKR